MRPVAVVRSIRHSLPAGAPSVGVGLLTLGLSSYGFLFVAARALTPARFASLSVLYLLVFTIGPGVFLPFEQELGRALSDRRARGLGTGALVRRATWLGCLGIAGIVTIVLASGPAYAGRLFDGSWALVAALAVGIAAEGLAYLCRGVFAGRGRFATYGVQLAVEGTGRFAMCLALAVLGVQAAGAYGAVLAGGFVLALVVTGRSAFHRQPAGPPAPWAVLTGTIGWLVVGSLLAQTLVNVAPVAVKVLAGSDQGTAAGQLLAGLVLARLPLFLFAAVQAALLPGLAQVLAAGTLRQFAAGMRKVLAVIVALSAAMTAVLAAAGPQILHVLFGPRFHLGRLDLVVLCAAAGFFMVATVGSNGLLALRRFGWAALGWAVGVAVLCAVIAVPLSLYARVELSFLAGAVASTLAAGWLLQLAVRSHATRPARERAVLDVAVGP